MLNLYEGLRLNIYFQGIWFILKKGGKSLPNLKKTVFKNVKNYLKRPPNIFFFYIMFPDVTFSLEILSTHVTAQKKI